MELKFGPSDQWQWTEDALDFEQQVTDFFRPRQDIGTQSEALQVEITQRWIDWAGQNGDMTYLKYREKPLIPPYVRYNGSIHNDNDFPVPDIDVTQYGKVWYPDEETIKEQIDTNRAPKDALERNVTQADGSAGQEGRISVV